MNNLMFSIELAKTIGQERQKEVENLLLLRQVQADRPREQNRLISQFTKIAMVLPLAVRLR